MRTANLTGALLDYWTARAEGVPAADLEFRALGTLCVRNVAPIPGRRIVVTHVLDYSTNWALTGPLVEKHSVDLDGPNWYAQARRGGWCSGASGDTAMIAICRAVVRAAFGDEVEDLPCA